jgi:[ribosomal protein S5]-alanine N-acetyltransferase
MTGKARSVSLTGNDVSLRLLRPRDAQHIQRWLSDATVTRWLARRSEIKKEEATQWVRRLRNGKTEIGFGIVPRGGQDLVGITILYDIDLFHGAAKTGTIVGEKKFLNRGYATEAKNIALRYAFDGLQLHVVEAQIMDEDKAAGRLLQKIGYRLSGRVPKRYRRSQRLRSDMLTYYLTRDSWLRRIPRDTTRKPALPTS